MSLKETLLAAKETRDAAARDLRNAYDLMASLLCDPGALDEVSVYTLRKLKRRLATFDSLRGKWKR